MCSMKQLYCLLYREQRQAAHSGKAFCLNCTIKLSDTETPLKIENYIYQQTALNEPLSWAKTMLTND